MSSELMSAGASCRGALIGPGRAGTTVATGLVRAGGTVTAVAGRSDAAIRAAADRFGARVATVADVALDADLVIVAVPDAGLDAVAAGLAASPALGAGALVIHLAGARGLDVFAPLLATRPDVRVGALHPLQTFPNAELGAERLAGSWCAVAGDPAVTDLAVALGCSPFVVPDHRRALYHAAACVASNHVAALLAQVERLAADAGIPMAAFVPLVRATVDNVDAIGAPAALTGPVARSDVDTVARHLDALPVAEAELYRAVARAAAQMAGSAPAFESLLDGTRSS